jgi:hypothetical protein
MDNLKALGVGLWILATGLMAGLLFLCSCMVFDLPLWLCEAALAFGFFCGLVLSGVAAYLCE